MHIHKTIETSIDLFDPKEIFAVDIENILLAKLKARYVNKCYQSVLIADVTKIIRYSDVRLVSNRLDGAAYVDVQFEIFGETLSRGEILHGCKVVDIISNNSIIVQHPRAGGLVTPDARGQIIKTITKNQIIPVVVSDVRYIINQSEMSIRGTPFAPNVEKNTYYSINSPMTEEEQVKYHKLFADYTKARDEVQSLDAKLCDKFRDIMYPFKTTQKFETLKLGAGYRPVTCDEKNIASINNYVVAPIEASKSDNFIYTSTEVPDATLVVDATQYQAISELLHKRILYLNGLAGFVKQYGTLEKFQEMLVYWKICLNLKE